MADPDPKGRSLAVAPSSPQPLAPQPLAPQPSVAQPAQSRINPRLLEILVCPVAKTSLDYDAQRQELISRAARLAYPIRDGIPIMLPEEARPLED